MLVYEGIKSGFIDDADLGIIADKIRNKYIEDGDDGNILYEIDHGRLDHLKCYKIL